MPLLENILLSKKRELDTFQSLEEDIKSKISQEDFSTNFINSLKRKPNSPLQIIAECKKASPSSGLLRQEYNPKEIALIYKKCGASAISILTESEFFQGKLEDIKSVKAAGLPVLRKDFIISTFQILHAKYLEADAILLIARVLGEKKLHEFYEYSQKIGIGTLVEVHNKEELEWAIKIKANVIGINHRNLDTLKMDMSLSIKMAPLVREKLPEAILVAESGLEDAKTRKEIEPYVDAVLVGTSFMKSNDIYKTWEKIFT